MAITPDDLTKFHPQTVLRDWGHGNAFKLADAHTGVCVFGATASGKGTGEHKSRASQADKCTEHEHEDGSAR